MRLEERKRQVLKDVIEEYFRTGQPVGSKALAGQSTAALSPAMLRYVMAELSKDGLLEQAHVSAGRKPTTKALHSYIGEVIEAEALAPAERESVAEALSAAQEDGGLSLQAAARVLSGLSRHAGLSRTEGASETRLKRIELVRVATQRVLVLLITYHGLVHQRLLPTEEDYGAADLQRFSNFLNEQTEGRTLAEVRARLEAECRGLGKRAKALAARAAALATRALASLPPTGEVFVEGQAHIAEQEELSRDTQHLQEILGALEDRQKISELLSRVDQGEGVCVLLGEEVGLGDLPVSLIAAPCRVPGSGVVGTLGVLGPTRMNYSRVIPLVSCLAGLVGEQCAGEAPGSHGHD
ncbi:MAG: heat-inducible transcriptional repressor HrcA [Bdellovibrionota bacterium]